MPGVFAGMLVAETRFDDVDFRIVYLVNFVFYLAIFLPRFEASVPSLSVNAASVI